MESPKRKRSRNTRSSKAERLRNAAKRAQPAGKGDFSRPGESSGPSPRHLEFEIFLGVTLLTFPKANFPLSQWKSCEADSGICVS